MEWEVGINPSWILETGPGSPPLLGRSAVMQELFKRIRKAGAAPRAPCLVEGPPGTGKELVIRGIHHHSPRRDLPLLAVNCAAIPELLFESEFFGHEKNAFSGALEEKRGFVEIADGQTLFLDEVGEMPVPSQPKTLRFLGSGEFFRVGGLVTRRSDSRILAATNRPLTELVREGRFRQDLYYRLKVVPFWLPSLKERMEDLDLLVGKFLEDAARTSGRSVPVMSPEGMNLFRAYDWPGNVRELENLIHSLVVLLDGDVIGLPELQRERFPAASHASTAPGATEADPENTRQVIVAALEKHKGNKAAAARALGIDVSTLHRRIKRFGLAGWNGGIVS
jgi:transcriptional regulator with GAF, ATPase, and Fis domain